MTRTTLHIGTTKTGSSSIQKFLATNRDVLQRQGALYPKALGKVSHSVIPVATTGKFAPTEHQILYKIASEQDYQSFIADRRDSLAREIDSTQPDHILISSEHMHSRCLTPAHFARLKEMIAPALVDRDLEIVVYLRPQIEHVISLYPTMVSHGLTLDIDSFVEGRMSGPKRRYHDFRKLIETWQSAFPGARMTVRAFNAVKTLPEGVISDFISVAGLDVDGLEYPLRTNESLSAWSTEALRGLNSMTSPLPRKDLNRVKRWLRENGKDGRLLPDPALSRRFHDSFAAENDWVVTGFLADIPDALEPNWEHLNAATPRPEISEGELQKVVTQVLEEQTRTAKMAEKRRPKEGGGAITGHPPVSRLKTLPNVSLGAQDSASESSGMQKTFVLGVGAQKAGTTWLRAYLNSFDFANFGAIKEYHIWDELRSDRVNRQAVTLSQLRKKDSVKNLKSLTLRYCMQNNPGLYEAYFDSLCGEDVWLTGDITPAYSALDAKTLDEIRTRLESRGFNLKVVFLMRDPVERCWSYVRMRLLNKMKRDPESVTSESKYLHKMLRKKYRSEEYRCRTGYNDTIGELEKVFEPEQLYYGFFEEMFKEKKIGPVCNFVGVPEIQNELETKRNVSPQKIPLDSELRKAVRSEFDDVYEFCFDRFPQTRKFWAPANPSLKL